MASTVTRPSSPSGTSRRTLLADGLRLSALGAALVVPAALLPALAAAAGPEAPACPVVALARRVKALDAEHHRLDVRCVALRGVGPEADRLHEAMEAVDDRLYAAEEEASRLRAASLEGAMFQACLAANLAEAAVSYTDERWEPEAKRYLRQVEGALHSVVAALERASGTSREEVAGDRYLSRRYDPHAAVAEALTGEAGHAA